MPTMIPTPVPSLQCDANEYIYRLRLYDSGGDGWEGVRYHIRNSTSLDQDKEGVIVAYGTLNDGFEGTNWVCLQDGCYEVYTTCQGTCASPHTHEVSWE